MAPKYLTLRDIDLKAGRPRPKCVQGRSVRTVVETAYVITLRSILIRQAATYSLSRPFHTGISIINAVAHNGQHHRRGRLHRGHFARLPAMKALGQGRAASPGLP